MSCNEQASLANFSYNETYNIHSEVAAKGLSRDSLRKLPYHAILEDMKATQSICTICLQVLNFLGFCLMSLLIIYLHPVTIKLFYLQDIEVGDIARSLPQCHHTFHLACVDKWLTRHGSCPVCRHDVWIEAFSSCIEQDHQNQTMCIYCAMWKHSELKEIFYSADRYTSCNKQQWYFHPYATG